jgi:phosphoglycerate dehydrogenase-like enzyme
VRAWRVESAACCFHTCRLELTHQLFSAGIDVFPDEPNVNPRLINNDKITLLPHMGTETMDSQKKASLITAANTQGGPS